MRDDRVEAREGLELTDPSQTAARMTFQDFLVYRMAGITYDRGVLFSRDPLTTSSPIGRTPSGRGPVRDSVRRT